MLANSNLSLVSPKTATNLSAATADSSATGEGFESVLQQASESLSLTSSKEGKALSDGAPVASGEEVVIPSDADSAETLAVAESNIADTAASDEALNTGDLIESQGLKADPKLDPAMLEANAAPNNQVLDAGTLDSATLPLDENLDPLLAGKSPNPSSPSLSLDPTMDPQKTGVASNGGVEGAVGVGIATQLNSTGLAENTAEELSKANVANPSPVSSVNALQPQTLGTSSSDLTAKSGNSLQAKGGDIANEQTSSSLIGKDESNPLLDNKGLDKAGVAAASAIASQQAKTINGSGKQTSETGAELVSQKQGVALSENAELSSVQKLNLSTPNNDQAPKDIEAGLAMLGAAGAAKLAQSNNAASSEKLASATSVNLPEVGVEDKADLDWIIQQMKGDAAINQDLAASSDMVKTPLSQSMANQATLQHSDSGLKQAAPLSLGLVAGESGLVGSDSEPVIEKNTLVGNTNKIDMDLSRSVDTNAPVKVGLGEVPTSPSNVGAQSHLTEAKLGLAAGATATATSNNQPSLNMQVPPSHPNWSAEMGEKVMWLNRQGIQQAEIHLDPPELGSLTVKVSVDSDVASVSFVAATTQVKDLLEGQVQRLREMMAQQGVELAEVDVNVSQQGSGSGAFSEGEEAQELAQRDGELDDLEVEPQVREARVSQSKVDFYA